MTVAQGSVIKIENGTATVKISGDEGCGTCPSRDKCKNIGHTEMETLIPPHINVNVNDRVLVAFSDNPVAAAALLVYLLPIICLIIGAAVGSRLDAARGTNSPIFALGLAVVCFIAPLIAFKLFKRHISGCSVNKAQLLEVYADADDEIFPMDNL